MSTEDTNCENSTSMNPTFKKSNILFLRGVYPNQLETLEEEFGNRLIEEAGLENNSYSAYAMEEITYDKIPPVFTSIETWPKTTNIHCWCCSIEFPTRPYFIPERIKNRKEGGVEMLTHGIFCSANCAIKYLDTEYGLLNGNSSNKLGKWDAYHGVKIVHRLFTSKSVEKIAPSPPKILMKQYGGELTKAQYRDLLTKFDENHTLNSYKVSDFTS
jgi:hypothetical protein